VLIIKTITELRSYLATHSHNRVGLVPTMGALHQGHVSLIQKAIADNDIVVVSIFVNPLQFSPQEDLEQYPRQLQQDGELCEQLGVTAVFAPTAAEMITEATTTVIPPASMTEGLCGRYRPGHFTGVATIVTKLLNIVRPDRAYFGAKDAQQLAIIRRLVADLNIPVRIISCPIIREASGLALSSRNQYLTASQRQEAAKIYHSLQQAATAFKTGERNSQTLINLVKQHLNSSSEVKIQYVELVDTETLNPLEAIESEGLLAIAAYLDSTRLIDNIVLQQRQPIIAIDGPAGAGKSTVTRQTAQRLGLLYLDTGAMYRAVTWLVMNSSIAVDDIDAVASIVKGVEIKLTSPDAADLPTVVHINGTEVTSDIRTPEVTANVSMIAAQAAVREKLVELQKHWGERGGIIAEGRDIGTNVFPNAELKIFLTASVAERTRRRSRDLQLQGEQIDLQQLTREIQQRDERDSNREIAPLKKADDAIELITDGLTIEQVVHKIVDLYEKAMETN
jgi:pantoate ligase / CMP/dCMP kinase